MSSESMNTLGKTIVNAFKGALVILGLVNEYKERLTEKELDEVRRYKNVRIITDAGEVEGEIVKVAESYVEIKKDEKYYRVKSDKIYIIEKLEGKK